MKNEAGFTLIELLVAFSVLLIGMTGIISMFSAGLSLERQSTIAFDASVALEDLVPTVKEQLRELVKQGAGTLDIPRTPIAGQTGLDYDVRAEPMPNDPTGEGYLVRIRVIPTGGDEEAAYSYSWLPVRLGRSYEDMVRESPSFLDRQNR